MRIERKYILKPQKFDEVIETVQQYIPVYTYNGGKSVTNMRTIYLDNRNFDLYMDYLHQKPLRYKIRIRQYGYDGFFPQECWVELKEKRYKVTHKKRFRMRMELLRDFLNGDDVLKPVQALYKKRHAEALTNVYRTIQHLLVVNEFRPVHEVTYERMAFQPPRDDSVRLTLDRNIEMVRWESERRARVDMGVLESKIARGKPVELNEMICELQAERRKRLSKFAIGIQMLYPMEMKGIDMAMSLQREQYGPGKPEEKAAP